eukprot:25580-Prymnesium_polylepis.5
MSRRVDPLRSIVQLDLPVVVGPGGVVDAHLLHDGQVCEDGQASEDDCAWLHRKALGHVQAEGGRIDGLDRGFDLKAHVQEQGAVAHCRIAALAPLAMLVRLFANLGRIPIKPRYTIDT